jgi:hypothetical protein
VEVAVDEGAAVAVGVAVEVGMAAAEAKETLVSNVG